MNYNIIGIDFGGTTIKAGLIDNNGIIKLTSADTRAKEGGNITLQVIKDLISNLITPETKSIGIGVPSVVDRNKGIVYNVQNIKDWDEVHLKDLLEEEFKIPVYIDNDANCFALGERMFGVGQEYEQFVGITLGTGVGGGIIQNGKLLKDANCGSGEFGELPYLDSIIEEYCGSRFFIEKNSIEGIKAYELALKGDEKAQEIFSNYGKHLANLIKLIVLTIDPQAIVFGGSITASFDLFEKAMRQELKNFPYSKSMESLTICQSKLINGGILGAGALCL